MRIGIIGAGVTGITAAYALSKKGNDVTVFEASDELGGLTSAVPAGAAMVERIYHHIFTSDSYIIDMIKELGLEDRLIWKSPSNGIYTGDKLCPFTTPLDLITFKAMPFLSRFRTGLLVLRARFFKNWMEFEELNCRDWLVKYAGIRSYEKLWAPLLYSKFDKDAEKVSAVWIWNKFKLRGSSREKGMNSELLGYLKGGFNQVYEAMSAILEKAGGRILYKEPVLGITSEADGTLSLKTKNGTQVFDKVVYTAAPSTLAGLVPSFDGKYAAQLKEIRYKANICVMLKLKKPLSGYYWITVTGEGSPFVLAIEHTRLFDDDRYGSNIVYLSRYLDVDDPLYNRSDDEIKTLFLDYLKKMFNRFDPSDVTAAEVLRSAYSQPVITKNYSRICPDIKTPLKNLYLASMAQIYPEDRGQNYAIRSGLAAADTIAEIDEAIGLGKALEFDKV